MSKNKCLEYLIKKYANANNCGSEFWMYLANGGAAIESESDNYRELLEKADYHYETYKFKKEYADRMKNTSEEWL